SRNRLDGFLNALQRVIDRHDILRSAAHWQGLTQPVQVVYRHAPLPIIELRLDAASDALPQVQVQTDPRHLRLDLQQAPLMAAYVAADPQSATCYLALVSHHMVSDHVTLEHIIAEIQLLLSGQAARLAKPLPYRNFIAQTLAIPAAAHEAYFREQLGDIDEPTVPFGLLNIQGDGSQVEEAIISLSADLAERIRTSARQEGVTPAVLFHVAWAQVLGQCSGRDDVVFGTVLFGRLQGSEGADQVLGMFINTLPVRVSLGGASVRQAVGATYRRLSELLEHEQASLALVQRCSGIKAPLPLFTALLNYRHSQVATATNGAAGSAWEGVRQLTGEERTNYPLTVSVDDLGQGFALTAQCDGVDPARVVGYLHTAIEGLVQALMHTPQQAVHLLPILPDSERQQLLIGFNATQAHYPPEQLIQQLFEAQAAANPEAIAVVYEETSVSYGELNARA
ncbi:condensation domain-containing protein, partial [Duganella violaceipulchra]